MLANTPQFSNHSSISILNAIQNHPTLKFYLTGSRHFGTATEASDWDFFVECQSIKPIDPEICKFLVFHGFKPVYSTYTDCETLAVYQSVDGKVHLQLVKDARLKADVQTVIGEYLTEPNDEEYSKSENAKIWNVALTVARTIRQIDQFEK